MVHGTWNSFPNHPAFVWIFFQKIEALSSFFGQDSINLPLPVNRGGFLPPSVMPET
jgi:hypothetical protein